MYLQAERSSVTSEVKPEVDVECKRSISSDFEVIPEPPKKPSADDIVKKYKKRTKNTLREGMFWYA